MFAAKYVLYSHSLPLLLAPQKEVAQSVSSMDNVMPPKIKTKPSLPQRHFML